MGLMPLRNDIELALQQGSERAETWQEFKARKKREAVERDRQQFERERRDRADRAKDPYQDVTPDAQGNPQWRHGRPRVGARIADETIRTLDKIPGPHQRITGPAVAAADSFNGGAPPTGGPPRRGGRSGYDSQKFKDRYAKDQQYRESRQRQDREAKERQRRDKGVTKKETTAHEAEASSRRKWERQRGGSREFDPREHFSFEDWNRMSPRAQSKFKEDWGRERLRKGWPVHEDFFHALGVDPPRGAVRGNNPGIGSYRKRRDR